MDAIAQPTTQADDSVADAGLGWARTVRKNAECTAVHQGLPTYPASYSTEPFTVGRPSLLP